MKRRDPNAYFGRFGRDVDHEFDLPENIDTLFEAYYALDEDFQFAFLSAASLLSQSIQSWSVFPSLSFTAAISAVETLVAFDQGVGSVEHCPECRQPRHRTTAKFLAFTKQFGSSSAEFKKYAEVLYDRRSKILHKGRLFLGEVHPARFANMDGLEETELRRGVRDTCRICLVNWLLSSDVRARP